MKILYLRNIDLDIYMHLVGISRKDKNNSLGLPDEVQPLWTELFAHRQKQESVKIESWVQLQAAGWFVPLPRTLKIHLFVSVILEVVH